MYPWGAGRRSDGIPEAHSGNQWSIRTKQWNAVQYLIMQQFSWLIIVRNVLVTDSLSLSHMHSLNGSELMMICGVALVFSLLKTTIRLSE